MRIHVNRLELIDDAILRPGRLGKLLYVPLPSANDRVSIFKALVNKNIAIHENVNLETIAFDERAEGINQPLVLYQHLIYTNLCRFQWCRLRCTST